MSHHFESLHRQQISNWHFLLSETQTQEVEQAGHAEIISVARLEEHFPELLLQDMFLSSAMKKLFSAERFGALMINIDGLHSLMDPNGMMIDAAKTLDEFCRSADGLWGLMEHDMLGCVVPEISEADCRKLAQQVQQKLAQSRPETISIGIAVYPTISYKKNRILENAKKAIDHAAFFGPNSCVAFDSISLNISGDKYYQNGDIEAAIEEYNLALKLDENNINVHNSLGVCYGIKNQLDRALESFKAAIQLDPKEVMPVYNAGYVHFMKKEFPEALKFFLEAERIDDSVFELTIQTGRLYMDLNQSIFAKKYLERATHLNPNSAAAFRLLGDCCCDLDQAVEAASSYNACLKLNPDDAAVQSALGYLYEIEGKDADLALMLCRQAVENAPGNGLFRHRLGRLYFNRNQYEPALEEFQKADEAGFESSEYIDKILKLSN